MGTYGFTSSPLVVDTDGDGYSDYEEVMFGSDPEDPESHMPGPAPVAVAVALGAAALVTWRRRIKR